MSKLFTVECCPFHETRLTDAFAIAGIEEYRRTNEHADIMTEGLPLTFQCTADDAQMQQIRERAGSISRSYAAIF